ncbi:MAG: A/G-specific adenine glycosylase [Deltaproteobacteria bacterium]|nr:A/G-specific adenine glycosylase [Deltaproteobacteria bacterium]
MPKGKSDQRRAAAGPAAVDAKELAELRRRLLAFYRASRRDLPWRRTADPYAVWVSEIMLQQTQVKTVLPRYPVFLARFPTIAALAAASTLEVCEAWAGLGYYRRAQNLHRAAEVVVREHRGELPRALAALRTLPGIGRYTAGAIASIAFGEAAPVVDGNVVRLFSRLWMIDAAQDGDAGIWRLAEALAQGEAPGDLNQALMEMGAIVCTAALPACPRCPVRRHCRAYAASAVERFPTAKKARVASRLKVAFAWLSCRRGVWLEQRPLGGLWAGLWELPSASGPGAKTRLEGQLRVVLGRPIAKVEHQLTHRDVTAVVYVPARAPAALLTPPPVPVPGPGRAGAKIAAPRSRSRLWPDPLAAPLSALARKAIVATQAKLRP